MVYTPDWLADLVVRHFAPTGRVLDPCRGEVATCWQEVPIAEAQCFDVAILRILGEPIHFALVLDPPYMLHTMRGTWSHIERWDGLIWQRRLQRMVRWQGVKSSILEIPGTP